MKLIGQGGVWKIYKMTNQDNVLRIPQYLSKTSIDKFIENYKLIKDIGLLTLKRIEKSEVEGKIGIICDNVNCFDDKIYVTYNSLYSDS
ncbi:hypothetical protein EZS27_031663 [termite gut metagenome]|uniref:Uncharacterized protein n=1 Tax=termite gut metagenome TaxID=433724 RepID=A0A5J4QBB3_9ZZZZ